MNACVLVSSIRIFPRQGIDLGILWSAMLPNSRTKGIIPDRLRSFPVDISPSKSVLNCWTILFSLFSLIVQTRWNLARCCRVLRKYSPRNASSVIRNSRKFWRRKLTVHCKTCSAEVWGVLFLDRTTNAVEETGKVNREVRKSVDAEWGGWLCGGQDGHGTCDEKCAFVHLLSSVSYTPLLPPITATAATYCHDWHHYCLFICRTGIYHSLMCVET